MSDLDQMLDAYGQRRSKAEICDSQSVSVKVPSDVRDEFYEAAKTLRVPRRELASALFMHGMECLRKQVKPAGREASPRQATEAPEQATRASYADPRLDPK